MFIILMIKKLLILLVLILSIISSTYSFYGYTDIHNQMIIIEEENGIIKIIDNNGIKHTNKDVINNYKVFKIDLTIKHF